LAEPGRSKARGAGQPREAAVNHNTLDDEEDPDWTWTRQTMARLLQTAFMTPEADLGWDLRDRLWSVLRELLKDPDPPPDTDDDDDPGVVDPLPVVKSL
jgi:hypothetical protein